MNQKLSDEIQAAQCHGRQKYGGHPDNLAHDDQFFMVDWLSYIRDHVERARFATPRECRAELVKVAGLCCSAIEAFDRGGKATRSDHP